MMTDILIVVAFVSALLGYVCGVKHTNFAWRRQLRRNREMFEEYVRKTYPGSKIKDVGPEDLDEIKKDGV